MGWVGNNYLPGDTKIRCVVDYLQLRGFQLLGVAKTECGNPRYELFHFEDYDFRQFSGVTADVFKSDGRVVVQTGTRIWCSKADSDVQNGTIRDVRRFFGGYFTSDCGRNRYLPDGMDRGPAESGCFRAFERFTRGTMRAELVLKNRNFPQHMQAMVGISPSLDEMNPVLVANNLLIPYLVACLEEYFRSTFISLLRFSADPIPCFKKVQLAPEDLARVAKSEVRLDEVVAQRLNFQNLEVVQRTFALLHPSLDLLGLLKDSRRRPSRFEHIQSLIEMRHRLIHKNHVDHEYTDTRAAADIKLLGESIRTVYRSLIRKFSWSDDGL